MKNAAAAMSTFAGEEQAGSLAIKCCSPFDELFDSSRPFFNERAYRFDVAESVTGQYRILLVEFDLIIVAESDRDSALCIFGRRFAQAVFGDDQNTARTCQFYGGSKACYACPGDDKIRAGTLNRSVNTHMVQRDHMPLFEVRTRHHSYKNVVERGILRCASQFIPSSASKLFVVTTEDVWRLHGRLVEEQFGAKKIEVLFFPGGEANKRLARVEELAEQMVARGGDRASLVIGFGGGIVTDVSGFLAAIFMRGVPVLQIPTTLLAQVDAATGGKTGVNLRSGKNLIGSFHQPVAVLIDPDVIATLPAREYRAGLFEVIKCGIIRDRALFDLLAEQSEDVLAMKRELVDELIAGAVRIKAEVVSADERETDLRRILNFGHTVGHAIEAETDYAQFLHGEAIAWGMLAATRLAELIRMLDSTDAERIRNTICRYGACSNGRNDGWPSARNLDPDRLMTRLASDKKTVDGKVHFVLPTAIGEVSVVPDIDRGVIRQAITESLQ